MAKAYGYDMHGVFTGEVEMQLGHLETRKAKKQVWLLPALATLIPPPAERPSHALLVWNGSAWVFETPPTDALEPGFFWLWANGGWAQAKDQTYVAPPESALPKTGPDSEPETEE